jgi:phage shock protein PspC (stress-responsive transcriptional regulator)
MADLEQAIADKCQRFLGPHKTVVTAAEVDRIVAEMGPIDATPGASSQSQAGGDHKQDGHAGGASKRPFRIPERGIIAGVCTGLAAYTGLDVALVRFVFVLLTVLSGAGFVVYVVLMFVMPEATTPEERAAAGGAPFNAQEVVDRAKKQYAEGTRRLRRHWQQHQRHWRRYGWAPSAAPAVGLAFGPPPALGIALLPVFGLIHLVLFLLMASTLISLVNTGEVFGRDLPEDVPLWAGVLTLLVVYQIVVSPMRAASRWSRVEPGRYAFWNAVFALVGLAVIFWAAANNMHEIREFLQNVPHVFRDFMDAMRDFLTSK